MSIRVKYIGTADRFSEVAITGQQQVWHAGESGYVANADAGKLVASGQFAYTDPGVSSLDWTQSISRFRLADYLSAAGLIENGATGDPDDVPTVTYGADFAGSTITGSVAIPLIDGRIENIYGSAFAYNTQGRDVYQGGASGAGIGNAFGFSIDDDVFEIDAQSQPYWTFQLIVNGKFAQTSEYKDGSASGGNVRRLIKVQFPSRKRRDILVINTAQGGGVAGIYARSTAKVSTNRAKLSPYRAIEIADSYGATADRTLVEGGPFAQIVSALGGRSCLAQFGGSGYLVANGQFTYRQRLAALYAAGVKCEILGTFGGINDVSGAATQAEILAYFQYAKSIYPSALHIVAGPWCPQGTFITGADKYTLINGYIRDAVRAAGISYIFLDTITGSWESSWGASCSDASPWITGDGAELTLTAAPSAATSATLSAAFAGATGSYTMLFGDGSSKAVTLTNGSTAVSWTGAVTSSSAAVNVYRTTNGNAKYFTGPDFTHPSSTGVTYLSKRVHAEVCAALRS